MLMVHSTLLSKISLQWTDMLKKVYTELHYYNQHAVTQFKIKKKSFCNSKAWNYVNLETMQEFTFMRLNNRRFLVT